MNVSSRHFGHKMSIIDEACAGSLELRVGPHGAARAEDPEHAKLGVASDPQDLSSGDIADGFPRREVSAMLGRGLWRGWRSCNERTKQLMKYVRTFRRPAAEAPEAHGSVDQGLQNFGWKV